jgi:hypothetical protein
MSTTFARREEQESFLRRLGWILLKPLLVLAVDGNIRQVLRSRVTYLTT